MNNLKSRIITGLIFGAVMLLGICYSFYGLIILLTAIACLCTLEYFKLFQIKSAYAFGYLVLVVFFLAFLNWQGWKADPNMVSIVASLMLLAHVRELLVSKSKSILFRFPSLIGVWYIAFPFFCLLQLENANPGVNLYVLYFFIIVWSTDTTAYFIGKHFGKYKLWESISPNKTIEGFIGGLIGALVIGSILNYFLQLRSLYLVGIISLITAVFTVIGDLVESNLKRNLNVKDSGAILPGHGGILDRFDGVLVAALSYYLILQFL